MGERESRFAAMALRLGCRPKEEPMRKTTWLPPRTALSERKAASSSLEQSFPSTQRAMRRQPWGSFPRTASASLESAASIWAGEGASGRRSSGSSMTSALQ